MTDTLNQRKLQPDSNSVQLVIFDCDGVLIDSEIICAEVLSEELAALGIKADCEYILNQYLGISYTSMATKIRQNLNTQLPADFKTHYRDQILRAFETRLKTTSGIESVLSDLNVLRCVATSSSPTRTTRALELSGLTHFFGTNVFTASEVKNGKPAPDLFLHAADQMKVRPGNCLVIEDSLAGLRAATSAGMATWHYAGGTHMKKVQLQLSDTLAGLPVLQNWNRFYDMAPDLRKDPTEGNNNGG